MKKYKLKKDTPTIKAGTIFQEVTSDYDKSRELVRIMPLGGTTSPQWTIDDIINFDEWFEEVKEFEEWRPKDGDNYLRLDECGYVNNRAHWISNDMDKFLFSTGNCYPLNTPDELIIKEQKLIPQAIHRLKTAAKKAWFEYDGSDGPDMNEPDVSKYSPYYDFDNERIKVYHNDSHCYIAEISFPTEESAQAYIDTHPEDMKLLFGVE